MVEAINEELYYFVIQHEGLYYPIFFGWILPAMVEDYKKLKDEKMSVYIELEVPGHRFICDVNRPLFMFNLNQDISLYSSDSAQLDLCPDGKCLDKFPHYIQYPHHFSASVETLFEYSIRTNGFFQRTANGWTLIET